MNRHILKIGQWIHPLHVRKEEPPIPYLAELLIISVIQNPVILLNGVTKEEACFLSGARESDSNNPSEIISQRVNILALLILSFRSFDLPVVTEAVLRSANVRLRSAPPTCPKWHFLDRGSEEYRTAMKMTLGQESK